MDILVLSLVVILSVIGIMIISGSLLVGLIPIYIIFDALCRDDISRVGGVFLLAVMLIVEFIMIKLLVFVFSFMEKYSGINLF